MRILHLLEGNTERLFHYTPMMNFRSMLASGSVNLSVLGGNPPERRKTNRAFDGAGDKLYYLSTSRNRNNLYVEENALLGAYSVILEFDGRELSRYGRIIPFLYSVLAKGEMEDRLVSDHPSIPLTVVKCIHVLVRRDLVAEDKEHLRYVSEKYPVKFYSSRVNWLAGRGDVDVDLGGASRRPMHKFGVHDYEDFKDDIPVIEKVLRDEEVSSEEALQLKSFNHMLGDDILKLGAHDARIVAIGKMARKKYGGDYMQALRDRFKEIINANS